MKEGMTLQKLAKKLGSSKESMRIYFDELYNDRKEERNPVLTLEESEKIIKEHNQFIASLK